MCGFVGNVNRNPINSSPEPDLDLIKHRGPDESVNWASEDGFLKIGFVRLSMVGLDNGSQPLFSSNKQFLCFINGEVYNHKELRELLINKGAVFKSDSDCETIPNIIQFLGFSGLQLVNGPFAAIVFDVYDQSLYLIRDAFGEKPIYYSHKLDVFYFSSELKPLLNYLPHLEINITAMNKFFYYGFVPGNETIFKEVLEVPSGHLVTIGRDSLVQTKRWYFPDLDSHKLDPKSALWESIALQSSADSRLCLAISGGIDSQLIAQVARKSKHLIPGLTMTDFYGKDFESSNAFEFSKFNDSEILPVPLGNQEHLKLISDMPLMLDDLIADLSSPFYFQLTQAARDYGFKGMLFGHGGDELDWGYGWVLKALGDKNQQKGMHLRDRLYKFRHFESTPRALSHPKHTNCNHMIYPIWKTYPNFRAGQLIPITKEFHENLADVGCDSDPAIASKFSLLQTLEGLTPKQSAVISLLETYVLENGFKQIDRISMWNSIEARLPILGARVIESFLRLNGNYKIPTQKTNLRRFSRDINSSHITSNYEKKGFAPTQNLSGDYANLLNYQPSMLLDLKILNKHSRYLSQLPDAGVDLPISFRIYFLDKWLSQFDGKITTRF
jgi:asparagine synthase (glutamine-hydrolysing)